MSFGSLSGNAIAALNAGAAAADCLHNTGEGGISPYHRQGGELDLPDRHGVLRLPRRGGPLQPGPLKDLVAAAPVRALGDQAEPRSQARTGRGAAGCQGVGRDRRHPRRPVGQDCISPSRHAEFSDTDSLLDWVELLAAETGLPVGIKSAVGDLAFWHELTTLMVDTGRGVDFVTIDGGEGGTGAAPLIFTDSVSLPVPAWLQPGLHHLRRAGLHEQVTFIGGGKLGLPDNAIVAFALGCDMVNVAREAMLAIGCIQAQKCHTDTCPPESPPRTPGWLTVSTRS